MSHAVTHGDTLPGLRSLGFPVRLRAGAQRIYLILHATVREAVLTMGRIFVRGTRDLPKVYADYFDVDGTRRTRLLRGVRTKSEAKEVLADIEAGVRAGRHGLAADEPPAPGTAPVGPLMGRFLGGLENRNAKLDRQRSEGQ